MTRLIARFKEVNFLRWGIAMYCLAMLAWIYCLLNPLIFRFAFDFWFFDVPTLRGIPGADLPLDCGWPFGRRYISPGLYLLGFVLLQWLFIVWTPWRQRPSKISSTAVISLGIMLSLLVLATTYVVLRT